MLEFMLLPSSIFFEGKENQKEACPYQMIYNITMIVMLLAISSKRLFKWVSGWSVQPISKKVESQTEVDYLISEYV